METDIALPERAVIAFPTLESARFTDLDPTSGGFYQQGSGPDIKGTFQASAVNTGVMAWRKPTTAGRTYPFAMPRLSQKNSI
jgi:hypothetical protein